MTHVLRKRIIRQVAGWTLIFISIIGLIVPVMPHMPFLALGALLLAPYVRIFRRVSAWIHKKFPAWRVRLRPFRDFKRPVRPAGAGPRNSVENGPSTPHSSSQP